MPAAMRLHGRRGTNVTLRSVGAKRLERGKKTSNLGVQKLGKDDGDVFVHSSYIC